MKQSQTIKLVVLVLMVAMVGVGSFFFGTQHAVQNMTIRQVTPTDIAQAMKDDHFWQTYRENTLMVNGNVSSVNKASGDLVVGFKTSSTYGAFCDLGNSTATVNRGDTITVLAESGPAQRQPSAVLLKGCVLL